MAYPDYLTSGDPYANLSEEQKRLIAMMQGQQVDYAGGTPLQPGPIPQTGPTPPMSGAAPTLGHLTPQNEQDLADVMRQDIGGMDSIMAAETKNPWTALAKTAAAGFSRHLGNKGLKKEQSALRKTMEKEADTKEELRIVEAERVRRADELRQKQEDRDAAGELRDITRADQEATTFAERDVQDEERLFRATRPELKPGTAAYGVAFGKFLEEQETRYGLYGSSSSGPTSAQIQKFNLWEELHPEATQEERQEVLDLILSSYKVSDVGDVDYSRGTRKPILGGKADTDLSAPAIRETITDQAEAREAAKTQGKELAKISVEKGAEAFEMEEMVFELENLMSDKGFDDAVGAFDGWIGEITSKIGGKEGLLGNELERLAEELTLRAAKFFKGNLSVKELETLKATRPNRRSDEDDWKIWFKRYKRGMERAQRISAQGGRPGYDPREVRIPGPAPEGGTDYSKMSTEELKAKLAEM